MLLQHVRHGNGVHDGCQHTHGVAVGTLHFPAAVFHAPPEVAAADDQSDLNPQIVALTDDLAHRMNLGKIQAHRQIVRNRLAQSLAAELQQNAPVFDCRQSDPHSFSQYHILSYFNIR